MRIKRLFIIIFLLISFAANAVYAKAPVVLMTDFGTNDGAVSAMRGVILSVNQNIAITDLTHHIEPFNIYEASYKLYQAMEYYPKGTIFVCIVDPGVGTARKSIVAKMKNGYFYVGPDNGILTYVANKYGVEEVREIDEGKNRLHSNNSSFDTFHGRDIYSYTAARLASDIINFNRVGLLSQDFVRLPIQMPIMVADWVFGSIITLDGAYGNLWTNISYHLMQGAHFAIGEQLLLEIYHSKKLVYSGKILFGKTFGDVKIGKPIAYINSVGNLAIAINQGNFAKTNNIKSGYRVKIKLLRRKV